ncbi:MAG: zinc ABC transporter substrate-binding protein [Alistipes sp.]|nr:zinc ABC transporter substrate-binding protein [Alistipes sp.]
MKRYLLYIALILAAAGCSPKPTADEPTIYVTIAPLRSVVERIVGDDFRIEVLVPAGASPETFEPSARQYVALNEARWIFSTGLIDFETTLLHRLENQAKIINLSEGIDLIAGSCSHAHHHHDGHHHHGVDPHIWTSPLALKQIAENSYRAIAAAYPDSVKYAQNFARLSADIEALDRRTEAALQQAEVKMVVVYHPALTYYARDYGLQQEAIEQEGKEPSTRALARLIAMGREAGVGHILYQRQYPRSVVETVARDMGAEAVEFDPLGEDVIANIDSITSLIIRK